MTRWGEFDDLRIDEVEEAGPTKPENPIKGYISFTFQLQLAQTTVYKSIEKLYLKSLC